MTADVDELVRTRLRALRQHQGCSLDELAARTGVGASTISRIETGHRSISLDVILPLARELGVALDELVATGHDDDVVIRPTPMEGWDDMTVWSLSRPGSQTQAYKIHLEVTSTEPEPQVHSGHDWLFVLEGTVRLTLGPRTIDIEAGESAEFSCMTPHAYTAVGAAADVIVLFDRDGARVHLHEG